MEIYGRLSELVAEKNEATRRTKKRLYANSNLIQLQKHTQNMDSMLK